MTIKTLSKTIAKSSMALAIGVSLMTTASNAAPVNWSLVDVATTDGTTFTGSFTFDAVTGAYSDLAIASSMGDTFNLLGNNVPHGFDVFTAVGGTEGAAFLQLGFETALTDAGGSVSLFGGIAKTFAATCDAGGTPGGTFCPLKDQILGESGSVVASAVPLPAGGLLLLSGLAGVAGIKRRKTITA